MDGTELLEYVKASLGITGCFQDDTLICYIEEVKEYLLDAGVQQDIIESHVSKGAIARGVADLWNYGAGSAEFSPYFIQRAIQLCLKRGVKN